MSNVPTKHSKLVSAFSPLHHWSYWQEPIDISYWHHLSSQSTLWYIHFQRQEQLSQPSNNVNTFSRCIKSDGFWTQSRSIIWRLACLLNQEKDFSLLRRCIGLTRRIFPLIPCLSESRIPGVLSDPTWRLIEYFCLRCACLCFHFHVHSLTVFLMLASFDIGTFYLGIRPPLICKHEEAGGVS